MILLAGLMGVLTVSATALVGLETATEPVSDPENDSTEDGLELSEVHDTGDPYLAEIAADLPEVAPETDEMAIASAGDQRYVTDAGTDGYLADDIDDTPDAEGRTGDIPASDPDEVTKPAADAEDIAATGSSLPHHQEDITGFAPDEDRLMIIFDDEADQNPVVGLEEDEEDMARTHVTLNGVRIAAIDEAEGLTLDHITLVPQSSVGDSPETA